MILRDAIASLMSNQAALQMLLAAVAGGSGLGLLLGSRGLWRVMAALSLVLAAGALGLWAASRASDEWARQIGFVLLMLLGPLPALVALCIGSAIGAWHRRRRHGT